MGGQVDTTRNIQQNAALLRKARPIIDLKLVQGHTNVNFVKMAGKVRLSGPIIFENIATPNRSSGPAENKLKVLEPSQRGTKHVQLGPLAACHAPARLCLQLDG